MDLTSSRIAPARRGFLATGAALAAAAAAPGAALGETWPAKPISLVVPFPPGGTTDVLARSLAEQLSPALGQPVVVENRPGAGATLGAGLVAKSKADGYTATALPGQFPYELATIASGAMSEGGTPFEQLTALAAYTCAPDPLVTEVVLAVYGGRRF